MFNSAHDRSSTEVNELEMFQQENFGSQLESITSFLTKFEELRIQVIKDCSNIDDALANMTKLM